MAFDFLRGQRETRQPRPVPPRRSWVAQRREQSAAKAAAEAGSRSLRDSHANERKQALERATTEDQ